MQSLGIKFPFTETNNGGVIGYTETDTQAIKSNLTAFLTLKKGHRVMNNSMYSPIYDYVLEIWDEISEDSLTQELKQKLDTFFPEISVDKISYSFEDDKHILHIIISYTIVDLKIKDNVSVRLIVES
jgi:hypothetical protein